MAEQDYTQPTPEIKTSSSLLNRLKNIFSLEKIKNANKKQLVIYSVVGLILISIIGFVAWRAMNNDQQSVQKAWRINPKFPIDEKIAQVGNESIYGDDLNYILYTNFPGDKRSNNELKQTALKTIATESAVLQKAQKDGLITLTPNTYNNLDKNQPERQKAVEDIRKKVEADSDSFTTSMVSVWFYNMEPPKVSTAQAEAIAFSKITGIHNRLKSKSINMPQAGDLIKNDSSLAKLDTNYQGNAYAINENWTHDDPPFGFKELNNAAVELKDGELSEVIKVVKLGKPFDNSGKSYEGANDLNLIEQFFTIIKMEKRHGGKYPSLGQWTKDAVTEFSLTNP